MTIDEILDRSLESEEDVVQFFEALKEARFIFHPDERAMDYVNESGPTFDVEQAIRFDDLVSRCFELLDDRVYEVCLRVFDPEALEE